MPSRRPHVYKLLLASVAAWTLAMVDGAFADRYAIIVANQDYRHAARVDYAIRDADAFERALLDAIGVPQRNIKRFTDLSFGDLRHRLGDSVESGSVAGLISNPDDELYIYFAGHGSQRERQALPARSGQPSRQSSPHGLRHLTICERSWSNCSGPGCRKGAFFSFWKAVFRAAAIPVISLQGTSAPASGPPVILTDSELGADPDRIVVLAAAQGDQFAVWDTQYRQSVFTDALVSALYGEADSPIFGGNADQVVTIGELTKFIRRRIARRLRVVRPGVRQEPEIVGGQSQAPLVRTDEIFASWPELVRRRHGEDIQAALLLSEGEPTQIKNFLSSCLYCPKKGEMRKFLSDHARRETVCAIERPHIERLLKEGSAAQIKTFKGICKCCERLGELETRLASLETDAPLQDPPTVPETDSFATTGPASNDNELVTDTHLVRETQTRLFDLNYDPGPADGVAGQATRAAVRQFQSDVNTPQNGTLTVGLLKRLRQAKSLQPWGAIVFDDRRESWGMSWNEASRADALRSARKQCGSAKCGQSVTFFKGWCGAFSYGAEGWALASRETSNAARDASLRSCRQQDSSCRVVAAVCASGGDRYVASE